MRKLIQSYTTTREIDLLEAGDVVILHCDYWDNPNLCWLLAKPGTQNHSPAVLEITQPRTVQAVLPPQNADGAQTVWFVGVEGAFEIENWLLEYLEVTQRGSN